jgi:primary-amine oxidase
LSWEEHWSLLEALRAAGHLDDETRLSVVTLQEPAKSLVWDWAAGDPLPRSAFAVVRRGPRTFEAVVDLTAETVTSWKEVEGIQPSFLMEEFKAMDSEVRTHPDFIQAMRRRGITDFTFIECQGGPPGYFGLPEEEGRRVAYVGCEDVRGVRNTWTRQIEGLTVVVDLNERSVLRVVDEGPVPVPTVTAEYDEESVGPLRRIDEPIVVSQPLGPGFNLDGHQVEWDNWSFHVRPDQRVGLVVSTVRYREGDQARPVLYQGHLSEIFVPYMDPSFSWYVRNFLDAGEYPVGGLGKPLEAGVDCPDYAHYMDYVVIQDNGRPRPVENIACIFERYSGDVAWRHLAESPEGRPKRDLVVRFAAVLGNYDYIFDWIFQQDGSIHVRVGATGIAEAKMVSSRMTLADASQGSNGESEEESSAAPDAYGRFVAENVVAVNHDHYFSFRLDLDVDGPVNSFQRDGLRTVPLPESHPRRSIWQVDARVARTEGEAMLNIDLKRPALWRVISADRRNHVGYPTSFQLRPGKSIETLLTEDDYPRRRAGFIDHHLWVTPFQPEERYAAGMYPTLSKPGQGLPEWTESNRSIEGTDIVLWYTLGMHHVVRAEDWPVMPVAWNGFELRPFDFFDSNPALNLSRER